MADHKCFDIECRITSPPLNVECRVVCDMYLNWVKLRDSNGQFLNDNHNEPLKAKRKK